MSLVARLRRLVSRPRTTSERADAKRSEYHDQLTVSAERLAKMRGDRVVAGPAESRPSSSDNVAAAAKDYGLSRFSGESNALAGAADSYRSSDKPKGKRRG